MNEKNINDKNEILKSIIKMKLNEQYGKFEASDNLFVFKIIVDIKDYVFPFTLTKIQKNVKENLSNIINLILKEMDVKSFTIEKL